MEINKKIILEIEKKGKNLIVYNQPTLNIIMGTTSVSGNLHLYKIKKEGLSYVIPMNIFKGRIEILERRKRKIDESLDIMKQIIKR